MKRPAVFFDRDNTLIISDGYLGDPRQVELVPGAADAVAKARAMGFATVVVSNQSGVARGMFDEDAVRTVNARLDELLREQNPAAIIDRHEFCPHHPQAVVEAYRQDSELRKPKPGMLLAAAEALALDLPRSWMIGDAPRDVEAGHAAGCRTVLFQSPQLVRSEAADVASDVAPDYVVSTLREAMSFIESHVLDEHGPKQKGLFDAAPAVSDSPSSPATAVTATKPQPTGFIAPAAASPAAETSRRPATTPNAGSSPATSSAASRGRARIGVPTSPATPSTHAPSAPGDSETTNSSTPRASPSSSPNRPAARPTRVESSLQPTGSSSRLDALLEQLLLEMRRNREQPHTDFSATKLLAAMLQVIVLAVLFMAYLLPHISAGSADVQTYLLLALTLQTMTIALMLMGRPK